MILTIDILFCFQVQCQRTQLSLNVMSAWFLFVGFFHLCYFWNFTVCIYFLWNWDPRTRPMLPVTFNSQNSFDSWHQSETQCCVIIAGRRFSGYDEASDCDKWTTLHFEWKKFAVSFILFFSLKLILRAYRYFVLENQELSQTPHFYLLLRSNQSSHGEELPTSLMLSSCFHCSPNSNS